MDIFGLAALGSLSKKADLVDGKIPAEQLPSYVDDVKEFADRDHFPEEGEFDKIYVALDTGYTYRWSGSSYVQIGGQDLSNYQEKLVNQENIKSINGESLLGSGNLSIVAYHPFPSSWTKNSTTDRLCQDIVADDSAVAGMIYLGKISCSDLPASLHQGEVVVEIISNDQVNGKNIHLILTSADTEPYRWEYSYVKINGSYTTKGWIGYQIEITSSNKISADLVDDSNSTHKFTSAEDISKLSGIEAGAQVNAIASISVGGTAQTIDEHKNVDLPAYPNTIPDCPTTTDGRFKLVCNVVSGVATYSWVADLSDLKTTPQDIE